METGYRGSGSNWVDNYETPTSFSLQGKDKTL